MARSKELSVFVLDVGPSMHSHLDNAGTALFTFVESKILNKPSHEVSLVLFGTEGTDNAVHDDFASGGNMDMYLHITVQHKLQCPDLGYLTSASNLPRGSGRSDSYDALAVALDMLVKALRERPALEKSPKRVVLVSDFETQMMQVDDEFYGEMLNTLKEWGIQLEVISINTPGQPLSEHKVSNLGLFDRLLCDSGTGRRLDVELPEQLMGAFRSKEVAPTTAYRGPLALGPGVDIQVRVYTKTTEERLPTLPKYSDRKSGKDATHEVKASTEYRLPAEPSKAVTPEETVKAYRYGKQYVPLDQATEQVLRYQPAKGMQLLGFVTAGQVPRWQYTRNCHLVLPDPDIRQASALSLLARAMIRREAHAVVRHVLRANSPAVLALLVPQPGTLTVPEHFVMNSLPYQEDLRLHYFRPLGELPSGTEPSQQQLQAALHLVSSMSLKTETGSEMLVLEQTANPVLQRFYHVLGHRALDPLYDIPATDPLVQALLEPQLQRMPGAQEALQAAEACMRTHAVLAPPAAQREVQPALEQQAAAAPAGEEAAAPAVPAAAPVQQVGTSDPLGDFRALVAAGGLAEAQRQLQAVVQQLVDASIGSALYAKAEICVQELRAECVRRGAGAAFNAFLAQLRSRYASDPTHGDFFRGLLQHGVTLVSETEQPGCGTSEHQAQEFLAAGVTASPVEGPGAGAAAVAEEAAAAPAPVEMDEFADME